MSEVRVVRFSQIAPARWKNGLGTTKQVAIHPENAGNDAFDWRVSIAHLDATAAFSRFEGVERRLAMLQGEMTLVFDSGTRQTLTPSSRPICFSGAEGVVGHIDRGPALDLNVMYRVPGWQAALERMQFDGTSSVALGATGLLCSLSTQLEVEVGGAALRLGLFDTIKVAEPTQIRISAPGSLTVTACIIGLQRTGS